MNLDQRMHKAENSSRWRAYAMIAPLLLFVMLSFVAPLGMILLNSIYDPVVPDGLPHTVAELQAWAGPRDQLPPEPVYAALAYDMKKAAQEQQTGSIANRLNIEKPGLRAVFMKTSRVVARQDNGPWTPVFETADPAWSQPEIWGTIRNLSSPVHSLFFLSALDLHRQPDGTIAQQPKDQRIYISIYLRTLAVALAVTFLCIVLGFPLAYMLAHLRDKTANLLLIFVLIPFWTSLLVRTTAWTVVLQEQGLINSLLQMSGLIAEPLTLVFNRVGVIIAMTHILLPFVILPVYSVMQQIPTTYVQAARSLGASSLVAFFRVYLPQCMPGLNAGGLLVFVFALGYYITPSLIGGSADQLIAYFVSYNIGTSMNWGLASALATILLAAVLLLYTVYDHLVGHNRLTIR
ncbi:ABC transporter permease [Haliscomenobacter sp.]|uniref:ABC transporter permease n=1 Tax=Haliscomenobacter sp. TaxID=2717303 RepID=UPI003364CE50